MFCSNCGKELPDGSMFCDSCGTRLAPSGAAPGANTGAGYDNNAYGAAGYQDPGYDTSYDSPSYGGSMYDDAGYGEMPTQIYAWVIAASYLFFLIAGLIQNRGIAAANNVLVALSVIPFLIYLVVKIIALVRDSRELKRCGYSIPMVWYILAGIFFGISYLFVRARRVDKNYKPLILCVAVVILVGILFDIV